MSEGFLSAVRACYYEGRTNGLTRKSAAIMVAKAISGKTGPHGNAASNLGEWGNVFSHYPIVTDIRLFIALQIPHLEKPLPFENTVELGPFQITADMAGAKKANTRGEWADVLSYLIGSSSLSKAIINWLLPPKK